ncbi:hypothetical protein H6F42_14770 [Pseudanabaena sp. FACHB-1998]|uniref:hypothetical protein n=1 Tax=Pseudanabaena sp. FACHB-1998 TaxID=2692858 RepID=UPI0016816AC4|nr:hypothetical protein [Pseudanabaena sp. FACHB-1998]MBD2178180.1 hypothetical protein [Pseudanabaena sp. FACHB-1998]
MRIFNWAKQTIQTATIAIASCGFWAVAIASANAQSGNILVYVAGNNPVTLDITRQVVTNPVIGLVNGRTSILTGYFDAPTADFVTRELQRRGIAAQQTYQVAQNIPQTNTPYVTLPTYLPNNNLPNNNSNIGLQNSAQYRYVTAVPMSAGGLGALAQVKKLIPNAFISKSFRGDYIYAGGYTNRDAAESLKHFLRSQGLDARVLYF